MASAIPRLEVVQNPQRLRLLVSLYIAGIGLAEALLIIAGPVTSLVLHSLLLVVLSIHAAVSTPSQRQVYSALMLPSLLRTISLGLPTSDLPGLIQYILVGGPLWVGIIMIARSNGIIGRDLGLNRGPGLWQLLLVVLGWPLGLLSTFILTPQPAIPGLTPVYLGAGILVISVFSSAAEEMLFRGILQFTLYRHLGNYGIVCACLLFVFAYLGTRSGLYVVFMGLIGILFAVIVRRTGTVWGVVLAHSLIKCGALLVWPFVLHLS